MSKESDMNGKHLALGSVVVALLLALAWQRGWFEREAPEIAELKAIAAQPPTKEKEQAVRNTIREQMQAIPSDEGRRSYFESAAPVLIPMMAMQFEANYDQFMKMSAAEQRKELDKRIDEMEARRKSGQPQGPPRPAGGGGDRPPMDPKQIDKFQKTLIAHTTPQQRAKFEDGMRRFNDRRKERGLDPLPPFGRGGRPF